MVDRLRFYWGVLAQDMETVANAHWEQFRLLSDILQPICGEIREKTVLDIGCGKLYPMTLLLHSSGNKVVGIDTAYIGANASALMRYPVALARNGITGFARDFLYAVMLKDRTYRKALKRLVGFPLGSRGIDIRRMDAEKLDFPNESFDLAVSNAAFEHIRDVPKAVSELARVLKRGGIAYISINLFSSLAGGHHHDYMNPLKVPPWSHLRRNGYVTPVYLNRLRENDYLDIFGARLEILLVKRVGVGEGKKLLTPIIRKELSEYSDKELLTRDLIIVGKRNR